MKNQNFLLVISGTELVSVLKGVKIFVSFYQNTEDMVLT